MTTAAERKGIYGEGFDESTGGFAKIFIDGRKYAAEDLHAILQENEDLHANVVEVDALNLKICRERDRLMQEREELVEALQSAKDDPNVVDRPEWWDEVSDLLTKINGGQDDEQTLQA